MVETLQGRSFLYKTPLADERHGSFRAGSVSDGGSIRLKDAARRRTTVAYASGSDNGCPLMRRQSVYSSLKRSDNRFDIVDAAAPGSATDAL